MVFTDSPYGFSFAKASHNLQLLDLRYAFCVAGRTRPSRVHMSSGLISDQRMLQPLNVRGHWRLGTPHNTPKGNVHFFLLAAAWVDPGRSALQSAEQWCMGRYGRIHRGKMSFVTKTCRKAN